MSERLAGLGINVEPPPQRSTDSYKSKLVTCNSESRDTKASGVCLSSSKTNIPALRSMTAMRGLLLAEVGDATVELDICGNGSGFREGRRILLEHVTPGGGSDSQPIKKARKDEKPLARHGTLLSEGAAPGRNAAELKSLLGNSRARLKSGAAVLPPVGERLNMVQENLLTFEQAKARARVEIDIVLESNVCVQGGCLRGRVRIRIHKGSRNDSAVMLSECKVRVVGFECIPNTDVRHTFYHCAAPLSSIAETSPQFYVSGTDEEGFSQAKEGLHVVSFAMLLPIEGGSFAKGVLRDNFGAKVRYIAMASVKVKNPDTDKRSISHFYRNCEVWPRLNPSVILVPATRPLLASTSKKLFMGGNGKLSLTATLHRLHWIAGQQCCINITVKNETKKIVRSLTLALIRTTVIFKPRPDLDAQNPTREHLADPDACQTSTIQKQVAESTLNMGCHATTGHVSAKGWWTGVRPGETSHFSHFLLLPADALSITRGRLLEVEYFIRVSLGTASLTSDVHVVLPVRIINFLSIDPPPHFSPDSQEGDQTSYRVYGDVHLLAQGRNRSRPFIRELFPSEEGDHFDRTDAFPQSDRDPDQESELPHTDYSDPSLHNMQDDPGFQESEGDIEADTASANLVDSSESMDNELGQFMLDDDSDDAVNDAIGSIRAAYGQEICMARFSDLYYASLEEEKVPLANCQVDSGDDSTPTPSAFEHTSESGGTPRSLQTYQTNVDTVDATCDQEKLVVVHSNPMTTYVARPTDLSSFASRVQEKLKASGLSGTAFSALSHIQCDTAYDAFVDGSPASNCKVKDINLDHISGSPCELRTESSHSRTTSEGPRLCDDSTVGMDRQSYATVPKSGPFPMHDPGNQRHPVSVSGGSAKEASAISIEAAPLCSAITSHSMSVEPWQPSRLAAATTSINSEGTSTSWAENSSSERPETAVDKQRHEHPLRSSESGLTKVGALSSVKARIKELEERAKASR